MARFTPIETLVGALAIRIGNTTVTITAVVRVVIARIASPASATRLGKTRRRVFAQTLYTAALPVCATIELLVRSDAVRVYLSTPTIASIVGVVVVGLTCPTTRYPGAWLRG